MSSTRASTARHVRQRKLNTKQALRIIRESDIEEHADDEAQRHIPQVETGVEKGEEIEYHLQAVINASNATALGVKQVAQSYIPTPETTRAKGVKYDELYPKVYQEPKTYIRFSSTVEDCIPVMYCMNDDDVAFFAQLNDGKNVDGVERRGAERLSQCSEDTFEEVMNFFEETNARMQPFANFDNAHILSLDEMQRVLHDEDGIAAEAHKWLRPIYNYWVLQKGNRPLMAAIKVRVLDTASEADDADPYVCFRRREVRQTRKTRGRDAQVVEKLKKLRLELEQSHQLVGMIVKRERLKKEELESSRKLFEQRKQLKEVKVSQGITGDKGDDEELLVNQKPMIKVKGRQDTSQGQRPATIRLRSTGGDRSASDNDLSLLDGFRADAEQFVANTIEARKEQHKKWNQHWVDETKFPITPPLEESDPMLKWALLTESRYPTPPPSLPSQSSQDREGDLEMPDAAPPPDAGGADAEATAGASAYEPDLFHIPHIPGAYPLSDEEQSDNPFPSKRDTARRCRLRYGRGGRCYLESRKRRPQVQISRGVVSDADSDDEDADGGAEYYPVSEQMIFEYRASLNSRQPGRPEAAAAAGSEQRGQRPWSSGEPGGPSHGHPPTPTLGVSGGV
ncbi:hypothetical protein LTR08_005968 [Meristemomyces frigidus]|nr:hypothetical protein LTR08_005968 [Meristemomyces frigidus]